MSEIDTTKDSNTQVVVQGVTYQPFGGVKGYTLGNGQVYGRTIDQDGRIASYTLGCLDLRHHASMPRAGSPALPRRAIRRTPTPTATTRSIG